MKDKLFPVKQKDRYYFHQVIANIKHHLNEDDHLQDKEDLCAKYLYLKLTDKTLKDYFDSPPALCDYTKFETFINLHGPSLLKMKCKNPVLKLMETLLAQPWYHENTTPETTSKLLTDKCEQSAKNKKYLNYFLIREVFTQKNQDHYSLEICVNNLRAIQKYALKDVTEVLCYIEHLLEKKQNYGFCKKSSGCEYNEAKVTNYETFHPVEVESKEVKRQKERDKHWKKNQ